MIRRNARLRVWANPYAALDGYGRPAGAVPADATHDLGALVGAKLVNDPDAAPSEFPKGDPRTPETGLMYEFADGAIELPVTQYYLQQIGRGNLFPADEYTAREAGVPFVGQAAALAASKRAAVAKFLAQYGEVPPALVGDEG